MGLTMSKLALLGGEKTVISSDGDLFRWGTVTAEMESEVLKVLHEGNMSGTDITQKFEEGYAQWCGSKYALAHCNGTAALQAAMAAIELDPDDEIICPTITYWASCAQAIPMGARVVFADIDPVSLCIDPGDFERRISPRSKAVVIVHYLGVPADMDVLLEIARRHHLQVIEDVSHAQGALYKGKKVGTFGDVAGTSLMSGKAFAVGEGGILTTDNRQIYERAVLWGHYERHSELSSQALLPWAGLPKGGCKHRMHQMSSAVGLIQLKKFDSEVAEIEKAMLYFWKQLEGIPGITPHLPPYENSSKGGWYAPHAFYDRNCMHGLSLSRFLSALTAEGVPHLSAGCNAPLHTHKLFAGDTRKTGGTEEYPVAAGIQRRTFRYPTFKDFRRTYLDQIVAAFHKVAEMHQELLKDDPGDSEITGHWALSSRKK